LQVVSKLDAVQRSRAEEIKQQIARTAQVIHFFSPLDSSNCNSFFVFFIAVSLQSLAPPQPKKDLLSVIGEKVSKEKQSLNLPIPLVSSGSKSLFFFFFFFGQSENNIE
jgi:hypothetical protein